MPKPIPISDSVTPFWQSVDKKGTLYHGHSLDVLKRLSSRSVHCCVTSPPYYGLRDYGICKCRKGRTQHNSSTLDGSQAGTPEHFGSPDITCELCGGTGTVKGLERQIGSEETSSLFVEAMVELFREVRRVLRKDGVLWLNLGDSYGDGGQLLGVPWRVALALQSDGWVLRSDVPWVKRASMPESCCNRPGKSLEYFFMLVQSEDYYFDMEAVRTTTKRGYRNSDMWFESIKTPHGFVGDGDELLGLDVVGKSYAGAHFATFGSNLIRPLILSSTSDFGCCGKCGSPYNRVTRKVGGATATPDTDGRDRSITRNRNGITGSLDGAPPSIKTDGWFPSCHCDSDCVPCVVLDPFVGSGTTPATAISLGRIGIGIDLNEMYLREHAVPRIESAILTGKVYNKPTEIATPIAAGVGIDD